MRVKRFYFDLDAFLIRGKVLAIFGPRQAGKTSLIQDFLAKTDCRFKLDTGDNIKLRNLFISSDFSLLEEYIESYELLVIDEAQRIPNIGEVLKILVDRHPSLKILVTGSSSFELASQIGEPLTGRKRTITLYPVSVLELKNHFNSFELKEKLEEFLIYGMYPEVISVSSVLDKKRILEEITSSYLFKDILELDKIKNSRLLESLLQLLAFQIGSEVSLSELATGLGVDGKTVGRYLDLLEKSFIIKPLRGFSRNLRKEVVKKNKYYFYDLGIRNTIIRNQNPLSMRNDVGQLFENFIFMERLKSRSYLEIYANPYFWRTWDKKEIDFIEERDGKLFGYECKWKEDKKIKPPRDWVDSYPNSEYHIIKKDNFLNLLIPDK